MDVWTQVCSWRWDFVSATFWLFWGILSFPTYCNRGKKWGYKFIVKIIQPIMKQLHNGMKNNNCLMLGCLLSRCHVSMIRSMIIPFQPQVFIKICRCAVCSHQNLPQIVYVIWNRRNVIQTIHFTDYFCINGGQSNNNCVKMSFMRFRSEK